MHRLALSMFGDFIQSKGKVKSNGLNLDIIEVYFQFYSIKHSIQIEADQEEKLLLPQRVELEE